MAISLNNISRCSSAVSLSSSLGLTSPVESSMNSSILLSKSPRRDVIRVSFLSARASTPPIRCKTSSRVFWLSSSFSEAESRSSFNFFKTSDPPTMTLSSSSRSAIRVPSPIWSMSENSLAQACNWAPARCFKRADKRSASASLIARPELSNSPRHFNKESSRVLCLGLTSQPITQLVASSKNRESSFSRRTPSLLTKPSSVRAKGVL